jgi:hypothetical protein
MQKFIVNGVSYDSLDAMPPDVRRKYERALETLKNLGQGTGPAPQRTVTSIPGGGTKIEVNERRVQYNIDGKTYDNPDDLPPDVRSKIDQAMADASKVDVRDGGRTDVRVVNVDIAPTVHRGRSLVWSILIVGIVVIVILWLLGVPLGVDP